MHAQTRTQTWPRQDLQLFVGCNDVHVEGEVWQGMMHTAKVTPLPSLPRLRSPPPQVVIQMSDQAASRHQVVQVKSKGVEEVSSSAITFVPFTLSFNNIKYVCPHAGPP